MYVFCYGLLHDSDKAKDIVQECFIAFWEHRTHIDAPEAISLPVPHYEESLRETNPPGYHTE